MTNDTDDMPLYTRTAFARVLQAENDWTWGFAVDQSTFIFAHAGWKLDSFHTEVDLIRAAITYWGVHPVAEDQEGPVFV